MKDVDVYVTAALYNDGKTDCSICIDFNDPQANVMTIEDAEYVCKELELAIARARSVSGYVGGTRRKEVKHEE